MPVTASSKAQLRAKHKQIRSRLSHSKKALLDQKLSERVLGCEEYSRSVTVFAFISKDIEVDTSLIIADALAKGKRLAVPRCNSDGKTLTFYYISSTADLTCGAFGILEPDVNKCAAAKKSDADLILVPGLAYDRRGYRIGFGKGFYDRFLSDAECPTLGLCYSCCVEEELTADEHDLPVGLLITDSFTIHTQRGF